jgi:hypothetical protein
VSEALASLPWVETRSIVADRKTRQAKFTVTDRNKFDIEAVKDVVRNAGYPGTKLLTPPTEQ